MDYLIFITAFIALVTSIYGISEIRKLRLTLQERKQKQTDTLRRLAAGVGTRGKS